MRTHTWTFLLVGLTALTACGAATDAVDEVGETRTASLHGTWRSEAGVERPAQVTVEQRALSAKLVVALEGHECLAESIVEAELTTDGVETMADVGGMHLEVEGEPGLDTLIANFDAIEGGPCRGQGGWFRVFRR